MPPPSRVTNALRLSTRAVACMVMVTGAGPQLNVIRPPFATARTTAREVQLAAVPPPTTRALPPVRTVDPGDTVRVRSLNAPGHLARQKYPGDRPPELLAGRRGHCLTGPIAVRGAEPGDVLAVRLLGLTPDDWGFTVAGG